MEEDEDDKDDDEESEEIGVVISKGTSPLFEEPNGSLCANQSFVRRN